MQLYGITLSPVQTRLTSSLSYRSGIKSRGNEQANRCRAANLVRLTTIAAQHARHVPTRKAISRSLVCSFSSTIPERKERRCEMR